MAFKDTVKQLKDLLEAVTHDLDKAERGNKAASQRVRTGTVKMEKIAKAYRKESIKSEKTTKTAPKKAAPKKAAPKKATKAPAKAPVKAAKTAVKAAVKPKAKAHKAKARPLSLKRPTAKLPQRASR